MKVLSLFDGIAGAREALNNIGITPSLYLASEIDKYAIQVATKNYSDIQEIGDITKLWAKNLPKDLYLIIGGSPCQDLSIAKQGRQGLKGARSSLFWHYVRLIRTCKPKYFILENVASMKKVDKDIISQAVGVEPIMINASLLTAQNRKRLFWVGKLVNGKYEQVLINQPDDKGILLKDILQDNAEVDNRMTTKQGKSFVLTASYDGAILKNSIEKKTKNYGKNRSF